MSMTFIKKNFIPLSMIAFSLIAYTIGMLVVGDSWSWTKGVFIGLLFSLIKFKLMEITFNKAVVMEEIKAKNYATAHYMLRYLLTGAVLFIAVLEPGIHILGVFLGLISMKVAAYMQLFLKKSMRQ
ncbi:ATP synthase subunit I [Cellulosilyticum sp. I15G10I2]|uniref:ATP synthase subunit I n=1 Tax=Cellulosilyticum sp. I15G10I2 TaxID=1892843 RepID=UPI00085C7D6D|nr:ATP synthase subunit I [Cellulosilyticum sp. I15G10I2]